MTYYTSNMCVCSAAAEAHFLFENLKSTDSILILSGVKRIWKMVHKNVLKNAVVFFTFSYLKDQL